MFAHRAYDLPGHGLLIKFIVPGMKSLLWSWPYIQLKRNWLPAYSACHYCSNGHILLKGKYCSTHGSSCSKAINTIISK